MADHGMSLSRAFLHLSRTAVKRGATSRTQPIGAADITGRATDPYLHESVR